MSLTDPINLQELWNAITKGKHHKAIGIDGIYIEFYKTVWDVLLQIINCMFMNGSIMAQQAQGHVICLPKKTQQKKIEDYRPLSLLNADYKILTLVITNRLEPILPVIIHPNQHCGIQESSVFEAVAAVRDTIAYAEVTKKFLRVVSIEFNAEFDKLSHDYLKEILRAHGFGNPFLESIMGLYRNASSEVQINGLR